MENQLVLHCKVVMVAVQALSFQYEMMNFVHIRLLYSHRLIERKRGAAKEKISYLTIEFLSLKLVININASLELPIKSYIELQPIYNWQQINRRSVAPHQKRVHWKLQIIIFKRTYFFGDTPRVEAFKIGRAMNKYIVYMRWEECVIAWVATKYRCNDCILKQMNRNKKKKKLKKWTSAQTNVRTNERTNEQKKTWSYSRANVKRGVPPCKALEIFSFENTQSSLYESYVMKIYVHGCWQCLAP